MQDNSSAIIAADTHIVGREPELACLHSFVQELRDHPRAVIVRGDAGMGKTTLWSAAAEEAKDAGLTVLSARCVEAELPLALIGLSDLVQETFPAVADELAAHERTALAVAIGLEAAPSTPPGAIVLPRAFLALLTALTRSGPVVIALDDAQWLDPASQAILSFAARRLGESPVGFMITQRGEAPDPLALTQTLGATRCQEIALGGLSTVTLAHLLRRRLDARIPPPVLFRVHEASAGNPLFALEFARQLTTAHQPQLGPLPLPASLEELVRARLVGYPADVRTLLSMAAAVERPTLSLLHSLDPATEQRVDTAVQLGAVNVDEAGILRYDHPLLAAAAYAELSPSDRRALHRRLAATVVDLEERARHLALATTEPDERAAKALDDAAAHAEARGVPDAAAELGEEAVRLTPPGDVEARQNRALAVVEYLVGAGRHADASSRIDEILAGGVRGPLRAQALLLRLEVEHDLKINESDMEEALQHVGSDRRLQAHVLLGLSACLFARGDLERSERLARQSASIAEEIGDPRLLATALGAVARRAASAGRPEPALAERALALSEVHGTLRGWPTARGVMAVEYCLWKGDLRRSRELLEAELDEILRTGGLEYDRKRVLLDLVELEWHAGRWDRAQHHVEALDELVATGDQHAEAFCLLAKGRLAGARGDVDEGRRLITEASALFEAMHAPLVEARRALRTLALALGEPAAAAQISEDGLSHRYPHASELLGLHALGDEIEALVGVDRLGDAEEHVARLERAAQEGNIWAAAGELRCRALILLARGDTEGTLAAADEAARGFEEAGFPLDHGRALLVAGKALRRAGERRRAAEKLDAAKAVFTELGAGLWTAQANAELRRARPRARRERELTSAERRVAALVAEGKTNREVAAQLFTTVATVEAHLTRIYRKLSVRSRTELTRHVAEGTVSLADK